MTDATFWTAVAAIAAAVSAALTLFIAKANLAAAKTDARSSDFDSCLDVVTKLADAQRRVRDTGNDPDREFEFRELLNLMEALALLENDDRIASSTRKVTKHFLLETYTYLQSQPHLVTFLQASITGNETFAELHKFAQRHSMGRAAMISDEKQYDFITKRINDQANQTFDGIKFFVPTFTAIIGGAIWLRLQPHWVASATYVLLSDILVALLTVVCVGMVADNLRAWHGYRERLSDLTADTRFPAPRPNLRRSAMIEALLCVVMIVAFALFCFFNPLRV